MGNFKVLVLDNLHTSGVKVFTREGIHVDVKGKINPEELASIIDNYDGIALRGSTKVSAKMFNKISMFFTKK